MQTIEVSNCAECPFSQVDGEMMTFDCSVEQDLYFGSWREYEKWYHKRVHENCPLKQQSITVKIAENATR